jgi:hypothetical protein
MSPGEHDNDPELARKKFIELLEDDNWRFTDTALKQGQEALRTFCGKTPSECEIIDLILKWLRSKFRLDLTPMGEPPGSSGIGWVMNNPDGNNTYIKLKIEFYRVSEIAWVISCHTSKYKKPT